MLTISHFCSFHKQAYNSKPIPAWRVYLESLEAEQGDGRDTILSEIATAREMVWEAISSQVLPKKVVGGNVCRLASAPALSSKAVTSG